MKFYGGFCAFIAIPVIGLFIVALLFSRNILNSIILASLVAGCLVVVWTVENYEMPKLWK